MSGKEVVIELYQAFAARDRDRIRGCFLPDARWVAPAGNATQVGLGLGRADQAGAPSGSNDLDVDQIVDFMTSDFPRFFVDAQNDIRTLIGDDDHAFIEHRISARLPNGRSYVNDYCFAFDLRDGKIAQMREYMDTLGGWKQVFGEQEPSQIA